MSNKIILLRRVVGLLFFIFGILAFVGTYKMKTVLVPATNPTPLWLDSLYFLLLFVSSLARISWILNLRWPKVAGASLVLWFVVLMITWSVPESGEVVEFPWWVFPVAYAWLFSPFILDAYDVFEAMDDQRLESG